MAYSFNTAANYLTSYLPKRQRRAQDDEEQQLGMGAAFDLLGQRQPSSQVAEALAGGSNWRTQQQHEAATGTQSFKGPPGWSPLTGQEYAQTAGGTWGKKRMFPQPGEIIPRYGSAQVVQR